MSSRELPKNTNLVKRALRHPPIVSPRSSAPGVIYVAQKTPFVATVKRARKYLSTADNQRSNFNKRSRGRVQSTQKRSLKKAPEVVLKATGRGIEKALGLALYFQGQKDVEVVITTGTVECVDDVVLNTEGLGLEAALLRRLGGKEDGEMDVDEEMDDEEIDEEVEDEFEERRRNTPMIEITVRKKE